MAKRGRPPKAFKQCPKCGEIDVTKFYKDTSKRDGLQVYCCSCHKTINKPVQFSWYLRKMYTLTLAGYNALLIKQGYCCAICGKPFMGRPCVDHDHACCPGKTSCGKCVRALLCTSCNCLLGFCGDNLQVLERAATYISQKKETMGTTIERARCLA